MPNSSHKLIYEFSGSRNLNTNLLDVTGLDGDKWDYIIEREAEDASTNASAWIRFNNDATANYRWYVMDGTSISGVTGVTNEAQTQVYCEDFKNGRSSITRNLISGSSGSERYVSTFSAGETNTSGTGVYILSHYWKNTVDNITSIQILENSSVTTTSTIRIYQRTLTTMIWLRLLSLLIVLLILCLVGWMVTLIKSI
jgi:hypothetical protein